MYKRRGQETQSPSNCSITKGGSPVHQNDVKLPEVPLNEGRHDWNFGGCTFRVVFPVPGLLLKSSSLLHQTGDPTRTWCPFGQDLVGSLLPISGSLVSAPRDEALCTDSNTFPLVEYRVRSHSHSSPTCVLHKLTS